MSTPFSTRIAQKLFQDSGSRTIRRLVSFGVFVAILTPSLLIALFGYRQSHRTLTELTLERRQSVAHLAALALRGRLDNLTEVGVSLADRVQFRALVQQGKWIEAINILANVPNHLPQIERVMLADPAGTLMAVAPDSPEVVGKNFAFRDWYQGVSKEWKPYVSEVYTRIAEPRRNVIAAAIPIKADGGAALGILVLQVRAETLAEWAREIGVGTSGFVYFVDQKGQAAVHPKFSLGNEIQNLSAVLPVQRALRGERGVVVAYNPVEREERVSAYEPVPGYGWGVIAQQPTRDAFAPRTEALQSATLMYALFVLLSAALGYFVMAALGSLQRSRQELAQANAWQHAILDSAHLSVISTDREGVIRSFNRTAERWLGYRADELVGKSTPATLHDPQEVERRAVALSQELGTTIAPGFEVFVAKARGGATDENEWTYIRKDGSRFPVALAVTAVRDATGNISGFLGIGADLSERKRLESELNRFFSAGLDMFCIADFTGHFRRVNAALSETLGWSKAELQARPFMEFIHPEDREATKTQFERQMAAGEPVLRFENRYQHKDGSWRWLSWKAVTFLDEQLIYATARDVTEMKQMDETLQQLNADLKSEAVQREAINKELESFSYSVSHDLRAPLRHVQGYAQMLTRELEGQLSDKARSHLKTITDASREMGQLIDDLLAFSRMSRTDMSETSVDLNSLLQDTVRGLEMATQGRNIVWKLSPLPQVIGDAAMLKLALVNLVGNAVKYTRPRDPAEIEIGCESDENGSVVVFVRD